MAFVSRHRALEVKKDRDFLIQSIRTHLLPAISRQGFRVAPELRRGPTDRESTLTFPFGHFVRARGEGVDSVEIQLAPYRRAAFRISAGVAPKEGMMTLTGNWPAEQVCVHWLNEFFVMCPSPRWRTWFSLRFWWLRTPFQSDYDKLALRVAGFLPEIELALRDRKLGPHMRRVVVPRSMSTAKVR